MILESYKVKDNVLVRTLMGRQWVWVEGQIKSIKKKGIMVLRNDGKERFVENDFIDISIRYIDY